MAYKGDKTREKESEGGRVWAGPGELGARWHSGDVTVVGMANGPLPRLEGLGWQVKGVARLMVMLRA
jgi:hypothetical protein